MSDDIKLYPGQKRIKKRTIVKPDRKEIQVSEVEILGNVSVDFENIRDLGINVIKRELEKYNGKIAKGGFLSPQEARVVQGHVKSLTDLMKENREVEKHDKNMGDMSYEEIFEIILADKDMRDLVKKRIEEMENESES